MRTLSDALKAIQRQQPLWNPGTGAGKPLLRVRIRNRRGGVVFPHWTRFYDGAEPVYYHAVAIPADGSLNRFHVSDVDFLLYRQRVAAPDAESDYTNWIDTEQQARAIAASGQGTEVICFYCERESPWHIWYIQSTTSGATYGAPVDTGLVGDYDTMLACAHKSDNDLCLVYSRGGTIYADTRETDVWLGENDSGITTVPCQGLAVCYEGDWNVLFCGAWGGGHEELAATLRPSSAGDNTDIAEQFPDSGSHYAKVDEVTCDWEATRVWTDTNDWEYDLYNLNAYSGGTPVAYIKIVGQFGSVSGQRLCRLNYSIAGTGNRYYTEPSFYSAEHNIIEEIIRVSPDTNLSWTDAELDGLQVGPGLCAAFNSDAYCTQIFVEVYKYAEGSVQGTWQVVLGDGDAEAHQVWGDAKILLARDPGELFEYWMPSIVYADVFRAFVSEYVYMAYATARVFWTHSPANKDFDDNLWLEPVPFNRLSVHGMAVAYDGTGLWLTTPDGVWYATLALSTWDVSSDLIEMKYSNWPDRYRSKMVVTLDNTGGTYSDFDKLGYEIAVELGYKTDLGNEYSEFPTYWITGWHHDSPPWFPLKMIYPQGTQGTLKIEAEGMWDLLKRWKARRKFEWYEGDASIFEIMEFVFSRIGLELDVISKSGAMDTDKPAFKILENRNGRWAIYTLLGWVEDELIQRERTIYTIHPEADDVSCYAYDNKYGEAHLTYRGVYGKGLQDPNFVEVWGDDLMVPGYNFDQIEAGMDRHLRIIHPGYAGVAEAAERGARELRYALMRDTQTGWTQVPINVGQEPFDVITITDAVAGVDEIERRVLRNEIHYNMRLYIFLQVFRLGAK